MSSDVMRVRLGLRGVRVLEVAVDAPGRLVVAVEAAWSWSRCPHCGFKCRRVHDRRVKRVWDQPVSGRETVLLWRRRRWRCDNCAERHLEDHPEFEGKVTRRSGATSGGRRGGDADQRGGAPRWGELAPRERSGAGVGGAGGRSPPTATVPGVVGR